MHTLLPRPPVLFLHLATLVLCGCGAPAIAPYMRPPAAPKHETPADHVAAARQAWRTLADPGRRRAWPAAAEAYNSAVAAAFDDLRRADSDWGKAAAETGTRLADPGPGQLQPGLLGTVFPASKVDTKPLGQRHVVDGLGLPVVGWIDAGTGYYDSLRFPPPAGVTVSATALLHFDRGSPPAWEFRQPYRSETLRVEGVEHPLRTDWSAAHALFWEMSLLDKKKLENVFLPARLQGDEGLFFTRPIDRDRIPLVFVHGLKSAPDVFARMVNELASEPWIRENYQLWVYSYPTGIPWALAARNFRENFRAASAYAREQGARRLDRTVIVGHSMGGLITQASLREPGNAVYSALANRPIEQLKVRDHEREFIEELLMWQPLPHVRRAVFLAAPHRGSPMADKSFAIAAAKLIRLPKTLTVDLGDILVRNARAISAPELVSPAESLRVNKPRIHIPTGIESLRPNRPMFKVLPELPFREAVSLHSIIGDRGRGDSPDSSDGVVPYWSSHLDGVESELIVPSDHDVPGNAEAIAEVKRILKLNLRGE